MPARHLFVARARATEPSNHTGGTAVETSTEVPVFITPQSLTSFPAASALVTTVWGVTRKFFPTWGGSYIVLSVISLLVGAVIFTMSVSGSSQPKAFKGWFVAITIASFNTVLLAAAALGILGHAASSSTPA